MDLFTKNIGEIFDGRYEILRTVGIGGMAIVYEALDLRTGRTVAVKTLKDSISDSPQALQRFINESQAVSMLHHEHIVKILDVSVTTEHKFLTMEYINGITLRDYMNQRGQMPWREAVEFIIQILQALKHAHRKGVIHRDIKPQNIMVVEGGAIKVMDFGIAKIPDAQTVTMVDHAVGTIYYISPEQARGQRIDSRSDLYSLGIMFYEMLTGTLPFLSENAYGIMHQHIHDVPVAPSKYNPNIPFGVEQIVLMAMEKSPDNRYQSASQMIRHLECMQIDPTTIFQIYRPALRTPTAEMTIMKTRKAESSSSELPPAAPPVPKEPEITTEKKTQPPSPRPTAKKQVPEAKEIPLSAAVAFCVLFVALAVIGFLALFQSLFRLSGADLTQDPVPQLYEVFTKTEEEILPSESVL